MSNFLSCDFGAISPELVVRSLAGGIDALSVCGVRTVNVDTSEKTLSKVGTCGSAEDLWTLFRRAMIIADDDMVAIRTTTTSSSNGAGVSNCFSCTNAYTIYEQIGAMFSQDEDGVVYLNLISIT